MSTLKPISDKRLKTCPFCGKKPKVYPMRSLTDDIEYCVSCVSRECKINPETSYYSTIDKAVEAWNKRA